MKKSEKYIVYALIAFAMVVVIYSGRSFFEKNSGGVVAESSGASTTNLGFGTILTGTTETGDVEIGLTPVSKTGNELTFSISINTHSVDLTPYNLKEITTLKYNGKEIRPKSAPVLGGHHISGALTFDVQGDIEDFSVTIKGIPQVEKRVFNFGGET